ncbi:MAG: 50S ribosomal protein L11 methyltransferase, partial [Longimicrobiales bacterium]
MYSLNEYGHMLADKVRTRAYVQALQRAVQPGAVVVEIGTGVGYFALVAARLGASRVYAFEPSVHVGIAERLIEANGGAPIQLIRARSIQVALTEQADVVFSDLRGSVPVFADHFASVVDARTRLLRPGGILIPQRDELWAALVESEPLYRRTVGVWRSVETDLNMGPAVEAQVCSPMKTRLSEGELLSDAQFWSALDYQTLEMRSFEKAITLTALRQGVSHGLGVWFDATLLADIRYSNHPSQPPL